MKQVLPFDAALPGADADLQTVLAAWHTATLRLEQTHAALREEVGRLTDELKVKDRELARKNRLADLGQMASHVAHEVRNNLVPVALYLSLLRRRIAGEPESLEVLDKIGAGFSALEATVGDLLQFTSDRDPCWQTFRLAKLLDDVYSSLAPQLAAQAIGVHSEVPPGQLLTADYHMLRRAVLNLVLNAVDAMPQGGELTVTAVATCEGIELEIADDGPGLSTEILARVFEPFYTAKPNGTGLGLAIVARIAEAHGGGVTAMNCPEGGAAFTFYMPHRAVRAAVYQEAAA